MSDDRATRQPLTNIPIPDPSLLTNEQFNHGQEMQRRELASVREILEERISPLKELHEKTFALLGIQIEKSRISSKEAIEAALLTQKEVAAKTQALTEKQLEALDRRISEIKGRIDTGEGVLRGSVENRTEDRSARDSSMIIFMAITSAAAVISPIAVALFLHQSPAPASAFSGYTAPTVVSPTK
jgi:hypothetical protein